MKFSLLITIALIATTFKSDAQVPNYVPLDSLIAWLPFDNNLNDVSGHNNNATGAALAFTTDRNGINNKACHFQGGTSYALLPNLPVRTNGKYSVNFWVKLNAYTTSSYDYILMDIHPGLTCSPYPQLNMYADSISQSECGTWTYNKAWGHKSVFVQQWRMLTHVVSGDTTCLYLDGTLVKKYTQSWGPSTDANLILGNNQNSGNNFNRGANAVYDDFGVWNKILTACEIKKLFYTTNNFISQQPANQNTTVGSTAVFSVTASITSGASYQWQTNTGSGFVNLSNGGQYSGVTTNALTVANLTAANQAQSFRCVIYVMAGCGDTSSPGIITLPSTSITSGMNATSLNYLGQNIPNPSNGKTYINYGVMNMMNKAVIEVYDMVGRNVFNSSISQKGKGTLTIENLKSGIYTYRLVVDNNKVDVKRMIITE